MLKRVRLDWIDGVLKQSLYQVARLELRLEPAEDAIVRPLNALVQVPDRSPTAVPPGVTVCRIFDDLGQALLILGAPGTGKTTLLLELTQELLDSAEHDESDPIPVVFNLSSWAVRRQPLDLWLVAELNERSDVPKRVAKQWVESEQIVPLLDGLDEVAVEHRQACVEAINGFRRDHGLLPIAICSRIADYEALSTKLRLQSAILIQTLTKLQVQNYLQCAGESMRGLQAALEKDASLWELLDTPLMLWVAMLAYRDAPVQFSADETLAQRRTRLFANFVDAVFKRRSIEASYTPKQTIYWLSLLGCTLTRVKQTVFYLESLNVDWLPTRAQKWLSATGIVVVSGLIAGLVLLPFGLTNGLIGLVLGLIVALIYSLTELRPAEIVRFNLAHFRARKNSAIRNGLSVGLSVGLIVGLMYVDSRLNRSSPYGLYGPILTLIGGLALGLVLGPIFGLIGGLITLLFTEAVETRTVPNQGTHRSITMALGVWLIFGLSIGLIYVLIVGGATDGLNLGLSVGLIAGLIGGGLFSLRHFVLRLVLGISGSAPFDYVSFLDYAVERLFLRKIGGGYIFTHHMLMEYFASMLESNQSLKQGRRSRLHSLRPSDAPTERPLNGRTRLALFAIHVALLTTAVSLTPQASLFRLRYHADSALVLGTLFLWILVWFVRTRRLVLVFCLLALAQAGFVGFVGLRSRADNAALQLILGDLLHYQENWNTQMAQFRADTLFDALSGTRPLQDEELSKAYALARAGKAKAGELHSEKMRRISQTENRLAVLSPELAREFRLGLDEGRPVAANSMTLLQNDFSEIEQLTDFLLERHGRYRATTKGLVFDRTEDAQRYNAMIDVIARLEQEIDLRRQKTEKAMRQLRLSAAH
jgi:MFS family permease